MKQPKLPRFPQILIYLSTVAISVGLDNRLAFGETSQNYVPLSRTRIADFWRENPGFPVDLYISSILKPRRVGFLPTRSVRISLKNQGVPEEVLAELKNNVPESEEFSFQVWRFRAAPALISASSAEQLSKNIITELNSISTRGKLLLVFPNHLKAPEPLVNVGEPSGPKVPRPGEEPLPPRMHIIGKVNREGQKLKAEVELLYTSDYEQKFLLIGKASVGGITLSDDGSKTAAKQIVERIVALIRAEMIDPPLPLQGH